MNLPESAPSMRRWSKPRQYILHGADGDGVVAFGVGEDDRLFAEAADGEDGGLGLIDDGRAELAAEDAGVGEGEGGAGGFVGHELLGAGAEGEVGEGAGEIDEAALLGLADDGHDSPHSRATAMPRLMFWWYWIEVSTSEALTMGKRRSASTAAVAMKGM